MKRKLTLSAFLAAGLAAVILAAGASAVSITSNRTKETSGVSANSVSDSVEMPHRITAATEPIVKSAPLHDNSTLACRLSEVVIALGLFPRAWE